MNANAFDLFPPPKQGEKRHWANHAPVEIVADTSVPSGAAILVGRSKLTEKISSLEIPAGLTPERIEEGYVVYCKRDTLVLAGNDEEPFICTCYAVVEFLRRQGVRWIMPGDIGDVAPRKTTITFENINLTEKPSFRFRSWWRNETAEMAATEALWKLRQKMQLADADLLAIPGDGYLRTYMPDNTLTNSKPELFGKNADGTLNPHMPNLINPDAAQLVADKVIAAIRKLEEKAPRVHSPEFVPDDGLPMDATKKTIEEWHLDAPLLGHEDRVLPFMYTPKLLQDLEKLCAEAEKLAPHERFKTSVRIDRLTLDHLKEYMAVHDAEFDGKFGDAAQHVSKMIELRMQLNAIRPFLSMPPKRGGIEQYFSHDHYWGSLARRKFDEKLHDMTSGKTGELITMAPKRVKFSLDEAAAGKSLRWHEPKFVHRQWREIDTTKPIYLQVPGTHTGDCVPYVGHMWHVFELDVPKKFAGKPIRLYAPTVSSEPWVWVNGEYAGNRKWQEGYIRPVPTQVAEGFLGRLFLWSPK